jgi:polyhydroxyalkanoate synthesis regulator phasin
MTVTTIDLFNILKDRIGETEAKSLVEFVEYKVHQTLDDSKDFLATKKDIQEIRSEVNQLELKIERSKTEMIKWMFIFWAGQTGLIIAVLKLFFK